MAKSIPVGWNSKTNEPTAPDISVHKNDGETTIVWNADPGVSNIRITNLDPNEFIEFSGQGTTQVQCKDKNDDTKNTEYKYDVTATYGGTTGTLDPKITNDGRPTPRLPKPQPKAPEPQP